LHAAIVLAARSTEQGTLERRPDLSFPQLGIAQRETDVAVAEHTLDNFNALTLGDQLAVSRMAQFVCGVSLGAPAASMRLAAWQSLAH
jgi:hypothetical protein